MDIRFTKIFSWDLLAADYDFDISDGRRCVRACQCVRLCVVSSLSLLADTIIESFYCT